MCCGQSKVILIPELKQLQNNNNNKQYQLKTDQKLIESIKAINKYNLKAELKKR